MDMARIYVGTYHKYNCGSIEGAWLDLDDYEDKDAFYEACRELHKDEEDPEFMFQDMEGIPEGMASESHIDEELFEWLKLDEEDRTILKLYRENGLEGDIDDARDCFNGIYDSVEEYVQEYWEQCGDFKPSDHWWHPTNYIDWEQMARDLETVGHIWTVEHDGKVYIFDNV